MAKKRVVADGDEWTGCSLNMMGLEFGLYFSNRGECNIKNSEGELKS